MTTAIEVIIAMIRQERDADEEVLRRRWVDLEDVLDLELRVEMLVGGSGPLATRIVRTLEGMSRADV